MDKAKKKIIEDGYVFAKGISRSKFEELESPVKKRAKLSSEERTREIESLQEKFWIIVLCSKTNSYRKKSVCSIISSAIKKCRNIGSPEGKEICWSSAYSSCEKKKPKLNGTSALINLRSRLWKRQKFATTSPSCLICSSKIQRPVQAPVPMIPWYFLI